MGDVEMYKVEYETCGRERAAFQSREDIRQAGDSPPTQKPALLMFQLNVITALEMKPKLRDRRFIINPRQ